MNSLLQMRGFIRGPFGGRKQNDSFVHFVQPASFLASPYSRFASGPNISENFTSTEAPVREYPLPIPHLHVAFGVSVLAPWALRSRRLWRLGFGVFGAALALPCLENFQKY